MVMVVMLIVPLETITVAQLQPLTKIQSQIYVLLLAQLVITQILHSFHVLLVQAHAQLVLQLLFALLV